MGRKTVSADDAPGQPDAPAQPETQETAHEADVAAAGKPAADSHGSGASTLDSIMSGTDGVRCKHCSRLNPVSARFCNACGEQMPKRATGPPREFPIRVRAKRMGFFDNKRYREGDVFVLPPTAPGQVDPFSHNWMERVDDSTPERVTTGQQSIRKEHDETVGPVTRQGVTGGQQVL